MSSRQSACFPASVKSIRNMSYRRPPDAGLVSSRWRIDHRADLLAGGIPCAVVDSDRQWTYVVLHGEDGIAGGWNVSWVTEEQAKSLLALLLPFCNEGDRRAYGLIRELANRSKHE